MPAEYALIHLMPSGVDVTRRLSVMGRPLAKLVVSATRLCIEAWAHSAVRISFMKPIRTCLGTILRRAMSRARSVEHAQAYAGAGRSTSFRRPSAPFDSGGCQVIGRPRQLLIVPKGCAILEATGQATRRLKNQYSMWTLRSLLCGYTGKLWNVVIAPSGIRVFPQDNYVHDLGGWHRRGDPPHPISTGFLRHFHSYRYGLKFHIIPSGSAAPGLINASHDASPSSQPDRD
jgi:hypothetical protein